jgi:hypothetical protein
MSRYDDQRLTDILASADAITAHTLRGGLDVNGLIYDAVRIRLIEIGEAVKSIDPALLAHEPDIPLDRHRRHAQPPRPPLLRHRPQHRRAQHHARHPTVDGARRAAPRTLRSPPGNATAYAPGYSRSPQIMTAEPDRQISR